MYQAAIDSARFQSLAYRALRLFALCTLFVLCACALLAGAAPAYANGDRLTAEDSRTWAYNKGASASGGGTYTLVAHVHQYRYTLHYDANVPGT